MLFDKTVSFFAKTTRYEHAFYTIDLPVCIFNSWVQV